jgi:hypothetical protein
MQDAGSMILEQQPMKTAEAIILFLQGQGHFPALSILQMSQKRARAVKSQAEIFGKKKFSSLVQNFGKRSITILRSIFRLTVHFPARSR